MYFPKRKEDLVIGYFFYNTKKLTKMSFIGKLSISLLKNRI